MVLNYSICVFLSLCVYAWLYITDVKRSLSQNVMMIIMILSNVGYLFFSLSTNVQEALLANKIVYIGGCYLPILYFFTVCEVCHFKLNKAVKIPLIIIQTVILYFVFTSGFNHLYYISSEFIIYNDYVQLVKEYGPTHFLYPVTLYSYILAALVISIIAMVKNKTVNRKELGAMIVSIILAGLWYILQRVLDFKFDTMPFSYIILMTGTIIPLYHSNLYTANENKNVVAEQISKVGFITFNKKLQYMGCNEKAAEILPELKKCRVGSVISEAGPELKEIIESVDIYDKRLAEEKAKYSNSNQHKHIRLMSLKLNENYYEIEIHTVNNFANAVVGFTIEFKDVTEHYRVVELTSKYNETLTKEVNEKTNKIRTIQEKTILGMAQMVESRDMSTGGHIKRTSDVVRIFSHKLLNANMGFTQEFLDLVIRSAPMHDLGKIGVDDAILRKAGKFNDEEYKQMKNHAEIGGKMVNDILTEVEEDNFVTIAQNVAHYHHEKVDGHGYPHGLKKDQIPVEARIMALADVFDALVSKRCYKSAFSYDDAFRIIEESAGSHFDEDLARIFLTCRPELEYYYNNCEEK
ncbi:MAG: HD domain-containing protein [Treponema sp.]|nr:HD domain-containing protein [Treponema sp.]